jgi:tetratricopeptide (TPR) repeat protein
MMKRNYFLLIFCFPILIFSQNVPDDFRILWKSKSYDELAPKLEQFIDLNPTNYEAIELLGDVYGRKYDWNNAALCYKKLVNTKPNVAHYHYKYGGVLGQKAKKSSKLKVFGLINQVKKSFSTAAALDPMHWKVRWAMVELYVQLPAFLGGSFNKALDYANELESISKINGYFAKAYIYQQKNDKNQSNIFIKKGVDLRQTISCLKHQNKEQVKCKVHNNSLHYDLGLGCMIDELDLSSSMFLIKKYISDFNSIDRTPLEMAHYQLAKLYLKQQNQEEALKHLDYSLKLNPKFSLAKNEKNQILMSLAN